jgi:hypothetical protein
MPVAKVEREAQVEQAAVAAPAVRAAKAALAASLADLVKPVSPANLENQADLVNPGNPASRARPARKQSGRPIRNLLVDAQHREQQIQRSGHLRPAIAGLQQDATWRHDFPHWPAGA